MHALPIALMVLALVAVVVAAARAARGVRDLGLPDPTLAEDVDTALLDDLVARKQALVRGIHTANLDLSTAKIAQEEHDRIVARLERDAVRVMRQLEQIRGADEDREQARVDLDRALRRAGDGDEAWSPAARLRHGGTMPGAEVSS